ncbi:MAG: hypothetical protein MI754_03910 [Chromatiales bacterium]|nr:hypothetical protein [Chromatiales bacterium]
MFDQRYDIYFAGEILPDQDTEKVRIAVGKIFNVTGPKLEHLFSGKPIRVKVDIDEETAVQYRVAFRDAGALVQIRPTGSGPAPAAKPAQEKPSTQPQQTGSFELLPANTGDLLDCAPPDPVFQEPNLTDITLAPAGETIVNPEPVPPAEIDTHNLTMSEPRTGSLEDIQIKREPQPIPDISHLHLDN